MVGREPSKKVCEVEKAEVDVVRSNSTVMGGSVWSERKGRERRHVINTCRDAVGWWSRKVH